MKRATRLSVSVLAAGLLLATCGSHSGPSTARHTLPVATTQAPTTTTTSPPTQDQWWCAGPGSFGPPFRVQTEGDHLCTAQELTAFGFTQTGPDQWSGPTTSTPSPPEVVAPAPVPAPAPPNLASDGEIWWCALGRVPTIDYPIGHAGDAHWCTDQELVSQRFIQDGPGQWDAPGSSSCPLGPTSPLCIAIRIETG